MFLRFALVALVLALPNISQAQPSSEDLLPSGSQLYFRYDGLAKHRKGYEKTAVGKMMNGEMGKFLDTFCTYGLDQAENALSQEFPPQVVKGIRKDVTKLLTTLSDHGVIMAAEVRSINPLDMDVVKIFPEGKTKGSPIAIINRVLQMNPNIPVKKSLNGVTYVPLEKVYFSWWHYQNDALIALSSENPDRMIARLKGQQKSLQENPLYKQIKSFDEFPTWARGYLDLPSMSKVAEKLDPNVAKITDSLGLNSIQSLTFQMGYEGPAERSVVFLNIDGPRKGILTMVPDKQITLKDLPPMPPDITAFSASTIDVSNTYTTFLNAAEGIMDLVAPPGTPKAKKAIRDVEQKLGVNFKKDLADSLGQMVVSYNSTSEGFLGLGAVVLIKVKDEEKLRLTLDKLIQAAQFQAGGFFQIKTTDYHGAKLHQLSMGPASGFYAYTYTIHNGWFAYSLYPQPLQGLALRMDGSLKKWEPSAELKTVFAKFPKEFTGITVSDPRPTVKFLLPLLPPLVAGFNNYLPLANPGIQIEPFDVNLIPNSFTVTEHLFPNVTIYTDEKKRLRTETRASLQLPF